MNIEPNISEQDFKEFVNAIKAGYFSIKARDIDTVELILKKLPSQIVNKLDQDTGQPALYFAILAQGDEKSEQLIKLLIRHGANIRFKDQVKQTILFYACRDGTYSTR